MLIELLRIELMNGAVYEEKSRIVVFLLEVSGKISKELFIDAVWIFN